MSQCKIPTFATSCLQLRFRDMIIPSAPHTQALLSQKYQGDLQETDLLLQWSYQLLTAGQETAEWSVPYQKANELP